jgi:hypothetical protein
MTATAGCAGSARLFSRTGRTGRAATTHELDLWRPSIWTQFCSNSSSAAARWPGMLCTQPGCCSPCCRGNFFWHEGRAQHQSLLQFAATLAVLCCPQVKGGVRRCGHAGSGAGPAAWWALCAQQETHRWCVVPELQLLKTNCAGRSISKSSYAGSCRGRIMVSCSTGAAPAGKSFLESQ